MLDAIAKMDPHAQAKANATLAEYEAEVCHSNLTQQ